MDSRVVVVLLGAGVALLAGLAWVAGRALPGVGDAVNPVNPNNVFSQGANAVTRAITGDPSLGGWIAEVFNPDVAAANAAMRAPVVLGSGASTSDYEGAGGMRPVPEDADPDELFNFGN